MIKHSSTLRSNIHLHYAGPRSVGWWGAARSEQRTNHSTNWQSDSARERLAAERGVFAHLGASDLPPHPSSVAVNRPFQSPSPAQTWQEPLCAGHLWQTFCLRARHSVSALIIHLHTMLMILTMGPLRAHRGVAQPCDLLL